MKKLIIFASVFAAVAAQAASVDWKADKQADLKNMSYAVITPAIVSALQGGASPYADESTMNAAIAAGQAYSAAGLASALTAAGATNGKGTASGGLDDVGDSFTMIFWSGTPADGGKFYYGTFSTAGYTYEKPGTPSSILAITSAALTEGTFTAATYTQSGGGTDPIPEPTTVALLALGLAAVGLKRKLA